MAKYGSSVQRFLLQCVAPIACSIVIGYIFFQSDVFNRYSSAFQFLWSGVVATVFYYLLLFLRPRDAYVGLLVLFFLTLLTTGSTRAAYILRDIFYVAAIGTSILLYVRFFREGEHLTIAHPAIILAGLFALTNLVLFELHRGILYSSGLESTGGTFYSVASVSLFFGCLIGFGVGLGITLSEKMFGPLKQG
jgi:hypothetical protein